MRNSDGDDFERALCLALDGVFAFALIHGDEFMVARDPIGVKQLYWGSDLDGRKYFRFDGYNNKGDGCKLLVQIPLIVLCLYFSSEMKAIEDICHEVFAFPPGHFFTPERGFVRYYEVGKQQLTGKSMINKQAFSHFVFSQAGTSWRWPRWNRIWTTYGMD